MIAQIRIKTILSQTPHAVRFVHKVTSLELLYVFEMNGIKRIVTTRDEDGSGFDLLTLNTDQNLVIEHEHTRHNSHK